MIKLTKLLAFLALFTFLSCSDESKDDPVINQGTKIPKEDVLNTQKSLAAVGESVIEKVNVTTGNSYLFDLDYEENKFSLTVTLSDPDGINVPLESSSITAQKTGVYTLTITLSEIAEGVTGPCNFSYTLTEFPPVSASLSGKWVFTKGVATAYGKTTTRINTADSALEVIEFRNDSLISYYYDGYSEETNIYTYAVPIAESWFTGVKYSVNGTSLTLTNSNRLGSNTTTYSKFSGTIDQITWAPEVFKLPTEFIGTWYLASESEKRTESYNGEEESDEYSVSYNSGAESVEIIKITADSITSYYRSLGSIDSSSRSISNYYYFFDGMSVTSGMISSDNVYCWIEDDGWEVGNETETYKSYTGDLPIAEWSTVTIPTTTNPLTIGTKFSQVVNEDDTLWFSISLNAGEQYVFSSSNTMETKFTILNENKINVSSFWNDYTYYAMSSGIHYIAAEINYIHEGNSDTFDLTVSQNSDINGNIRSSRAVELNRNPQIQGGQYIRR